MQHGKAIGYCMAYQMYYECTEGSVNRLWKLENPMSATEFRGRASLQMCQHQSSQEVSWRCKNENNNAKMEADEGNGKTEAGKG